MDDHHSGLRERKKQRTKRALVGAALRLFAEKGYDNTTVAEIAAAAEVSYATFFNYFTAKEEVVFADDDLYGPLLDSALASRTPGERPAELLQRVVRELAEAPSWSFPLDHKLTMVRARLIADVPALRAASLLRTADLQQRLARALCEVFPDELNELHGAALTGATFGAVDAVLRTVASGGSTGESTSALVHKAVTIALHGHLRD